MSLPALPALPALLALIIADPGLLALGLWTLRTRSWYNGIPAAEMLVDGIGGATPPPRTAADRHFARFHAWMSIIFGAFFSLCLLAAIFSLLSE